MWWCTKMGYLPPTNENVVHAHFRVAFWQNVLQPDPSGRDPFPTNGPNQIRREWTHSRLIDPTRSVWNGPIPDKWTQPDPSGMDPFPTNGPNQIRLEWTHSRLMDPTAFRWSLEDGSKTLFPTLLPTDTPLHHMIC